MSEMDLGEPETFEVALDRLLGVWLKRESHAAMCKVLAYAIVDLTERSEHLTKLWWDEQDRQRAAGAPTEPDRPD